METDDIFIGFLDSTAAAGTRSAEPGARRDL